MVNSQHSPCAAPRQRVTCPRVSAATRVVPEVDCNIIIIVILSFVRSTIQNEPRNIPRLDSINTDTKSDKILQWASVFEAADDKSDRRHQTDEYYRDADHHGHLDVHLECRDRD